MSENEGSKGSTFKKFNLRFYAKNTAVPNSVTFNQNLKDSAKLLLIALHSLPETWTIYQSTLAEMLGWGCDKIASAVEILTTQGYLRRTQNRAEKGKFGAFSYEFYWEPIFKENPNIQPDPMPFETPKEEAVTGRVLSGTGETGTRQSGSSGYIDSSVSNNISNIKEPPTPNAKKDESLVGGIHKESKKENDIYQCLREIKIQPKDKIRLTSKFDEATVAKAVAHCTSPTFKVQGTLDGSIFYFCNHPEYITETKEAKEARKQKEEDAKRDRQQNRKQFATLIMKHFWSKRSEGICIRDDNEYLEIYNDRIKEKIYYVDEKFKTLLSHVLSKLGLEQPKFLGQIA